MNAVPFLRPGSVTLRVPDLAGSLAFYRDVLGLRAAGGEGAGGGGAVRLGPGEGGPPLLLLEEAPSAPPAPVRSAGLFHLALRVPSRPALARALRGLGAAGVRLQGLSDHGVSEALYLADPHGNGVEIYADRPRDAWTWRGGELEMVTRPLDVENLLEEAAKPSGREGEDGPLLPAGTDLGHVHLRVTDLEEAEAFWAGVLGLPVTTRRYPGALFFGAGGYHHHVGVNVWSTGGGTPLPEGAQGLVEVSVVTSDPALPTQALRRARQAGFAADPEEGGGAAEPAGRTREPGEDDRGHGSASALLRDADGIRVRISTVPSVR